MTSPVANLIETLSSTPGLEVKEAGATMLAALSGGTVSIEAFREDPRVLMSSEHGVSRYLAQVVWRALGGDYESLDEIVAGLYGVLDRNPPVIEAASPEKGAGDPRVVIPEARILRVGPLVRSDTDGWEASFEAQVTSGQLRNQEIAIHAHASVNPSACFIVPYFWIHARVAAYNLVPDQGKHYSAGPDTFFVLEPLRQVNATAVARSLHCPKPQIDQIRKGRGDVTVHTLKGMVVHSMLDRIIEGEDDLDACYVRVLPTFWSSWHRSRMNPSTKMRFVRMYSGMQRRSKSLSNSIRTCVGILKWSCGGIQRRSVFRAVSTPCSRARTSWISSS